jgi:hypothetical protein
LDAESIREKVRGNQYVYSQHADLAARDDDLTFSQIEQALLECSMLEHYPDTGRGDSCLVVGFAGEIPVHVVCGTRGDRIVLITVYVPGPPDFRDPWTRATPGAASGVEE